MHSDKTFYPEYRLLRPIDHGKRIKNVTCCIDAFSMSPVLLYTLVHAHHLCPSSHMTIGSLLYYAFFFVVAAHSSFSLPFVLAY